MKKYTVLMQTHYPATFITEFVEIEAETPEAAAEYVLNGDGYLLQEIVEHGEAADEEIIEVVEI